MNIMNFHMDFLESEFDMHDEYIAMINHNPNCIYYTNINVEENVIELVEHLPGVYSRVIHFDPLGKDCPDNVLSQQLATFLNGRNQCVTSCKRIDTGVFWSFTEMLKESKKKYPEMGETLGTFNLEYCGKSLRVSIVYESDCIDSEDVDDEPDIEIAIQYAKSFRFEIVKGGEE